MVLHEHGFMSCSKWRLNCVLFLHSNISVGEVTVFPSMQCESFLPTELKFATLKIGIAVCSKTVGPVCYYMQLYMVEDSDIGTHCCMNHMQLYMLEDSDTGTHCCMNHVQLHTVADSWACLLLYAAVHARRWWYWYSLLYEPCTAAYSSRHWAFLLLYAAVHARRQWYWYLLLYEPCTAAYSSRQLGISTAVCSCTC
jgi:hypothetical protein